ncbi:MAG: 3-keto-5-aminohexanoate cleavage protein [Spirochaetota bacterium]
MKKGPIIISLAPIGAWPVLGVHSPYLPEEVAQDIRRCEEEGAALVHLHVRDETGAATTDMGVFNATLESLRMDSSLILQGSTGGVEGLSAAERCVVLSNEAVEMASLNMGSTNFFGGVYVNSPDDIRYWAGDMQARGIVPELELFSLTMIPASLRLHAEGILEAPLRFSLCMGIPGAIPLDPRFIYMAAALIPDAAVWGLMLHGRTEPSLVATAIALGARWIRVGFEDSPYDVYGTSASRNSDLVAALRDYISRLGYELADVSQARELLCLNS